MVRRSRRTRQRAQARDSAARSRVLRQEDSYTNSDEEWDRCQRLGCRSDLSGTRTVSNCMRCQLSVCKDCTKWFCHEARCNKAICYACFSDASIPKTSGCCNSPFVNPRLCQHCYRTGGMFFLAKHSSSADSVGRSEERAHDSRAPSRKIAASSARERLPHSALESVHSRSDNRVESKGCSTDPDRHEPESGNRESSASEEEEDSDCDLQEAALVRLVASRSSAIHEHSHQSKRRTRAMRAQRDKTARDRASRRARQLRLGRELFGMRCLGCDELGLAAVCSSHGSTLFCSACALWRPLFCPAGHSGNKSGTFPCARDSCVLHAQARALATCEQRLSRDVRSVIAQYLAGPAAGTATATPAEPRDYSRIRNGSFHLSLKVAHSHRAR